MPKNPKRDPSGSSNVFLQTDNFKKIQGGTSPKNFGKKSHSAEKNPLVYPLLLETLKNCGLVRDSNPHTPASEGLEITWRRS